MAEINRACNGRHHRSLLVVSHLGFHCSLPRVICITTSLSTSRLTSADTCVGVSVEVATTTLSTSFTTSLSTTTGVAAAPQPTAKSSDMITPILEIRETVGLNLTECCMAGLRPTLRFLTPCYSIV